MRAAILSLISLFFLLFNHSVKTQSTEIESLLTLYNCTDGANWTNNSGWEEGAAGTRTDYCNWYGVVCNDNENVSELRLINNNLEGNLSPTISNLKDLSYLLLSANQISGIIPKEISDLTNLTFLHIAFNDLYGSIPPELENLTNLSDLNLMGNDLIGSIPSALGSLSNLQSLNLSGNNLSGSIPSEIGDLTALQHLNLGANQLENNIPLELWNLSNLESLNLELNYLDGNIPPQIGNLSNLISLFLNYNAFSGEIPTEIENVSDLKYLNLTNNTFTGSLPTEFGQLDSLRALYIANNMINGSIPSDIGSLSDLLFLDLGSNNLTDTLSDLLGQLGNLREIYLDSNQLSGPIPTEFGSISNLEVLDLASNNISGNLPSEVGGLPNLSSINLNGNQLTGCIPSSYSNLCGNNILMDGNNLLTTWENFCLNGAMSCSESPSCPINTGAYLEGALIVEGRSQYNSQMHINLNDFGLLPGQEPTKGFATRTDMGQPFNSVAFNFYNGSEGDDFADYQSDVTDWILVDLRRTLDANTNICRQAALLHQDGRISFREQHCNCAIEDGDELRIAIHHRNHLPIISEFITVENSSVLYDFRNTPAYRRGFNQSSKLLDDGRYVMIGGNGFHGREGSTLDYGDVNAIDIRKWREENAHNDIYIDSDFDLNSDVNSNDKFILLLNGGLTSSITN